MHPRQATSGTKRVSEGGGADDFVDLVDTHFQKPRYPWNKGLTLRADQIRVPWNAGRRLSQRYRERLLGIEMRQKDAAIEQLRAEVKRFREQVEELSAILSGLGHRPL